MEPSPGSFSDLGKTSKRIAHDLLAIGENRLELFMVEAQEERERLFCALLLVVGIFFFGLLAGITLTFTIVILMWEHSPLATLIVLTLLYGATTALCCHRLKQLRQDWRSFAATIDQLRKDRECLRERMD